MTDVIFSWKARYTITIGSSDKREYDVDIDDPSENEIIKSPFYKGNKENIRRYIVRRKADANVTKFCNRLAVETESPTSYFKNSLDFLENGVKKFSEREISYGASVQIGASISEADFLSLEEKVSASSDELLDIYSELYNRFLKSRDVFEKYKLLYLIANNEAYKDLALRTIRNMLHHTELDCVHHLDQCRKADELFGSGVRSIQLSNPDHQRKVQEHLPDLRHIAKSIIDGLK